MGANDATHRPVLDAENKPSLVVEARAWADELEGVLFDGAPVAEVGLIRRLADALVEAEKVRPLHSIATQRTVDLAASLERVRAAVRLLDAGDITPAGRRVLEKVLEADTAAVLAEHDREIAETAWDAGHAEAQSMNGWSINLTTCENNPHRSGRVPVPVKESNDE